MGTRSLIGKLNEDGTVRYVYCHWDGYPSNNGAILLAHYTDAAKIDALLDEGNISSLGAELGTRHNFDAERPKGQCTFYMRDRGESGEDAQVARDESEFYRRDMGTEYWYLFKGGKWNYSDNGRKPKRLTKAACKR